MLIQLIERLSFGITVPPNGNRTLCEGKAPCAIGSMVGCSSWVAYNKGGTKMLLCVINCRSRPDLLNSSEKAMDLHVRHGERLGRSMILIETFEGYFSKLHSSLQRWEDSSTERLARCATCILLQAGKS
jgi:hypothetical protein